MSARIAPPELAERCIVRVIRALQLAQADQALHGLLPRQAELIEGAEADLGRVGWLIGYALEEARHA